ncbi:hypothetical protein ACFV97_20140 [Streptomyces sp. NPDC059913]|uniref:hypothetical protein n=1 Tax=unclassified Streptomyces TaxID=2593676 RepID=UPI0036496207
MRAFLRLPWGQPSDYDRHTSHREQRQRRSRTPERPDYPYFPPIYRPTDPSGGRTRSQGADINATSRHRDTTGRAARALALTGAAILALGGCDALNTDKTPERVRNGTNELDLKVTGRPTPGSLSVTEQVLARLKARDADGLAALATSDGNPESDAQRWTARWSGPAQHPATADFFQGERESTVDIRFTDEGSTLSLVLRDHDYDDAYDVVLNDEG